MSDADANSPSGQVPSSGLHYAGFKAITWLSSNLPLEVQYAIARLGADMYFKLDHKARESVCSNLEAVYGYDMQPAKLRGQARRVFQSFGRYLCEFFGIEHFSWPYIDRHVMVYGREHIDNALKAKRGVLFCSGHYSNWELGPWVIARMGYPITAITLRHAHPKVNELFVSQRAERGVHVIHSQDGARGAMRALHANQTVAMLGDRPTGGPTVEVNFFGRKTHVPQGPWRIALKTGAALLPTFVTRQPENDYILEIGAPITIPCYNDSNDISIRTQAMAQAWASCMEAKVRSDPTQWEVFYRIWDR